MEDFKTFIHTLAEKSAEAIMPWFRSPALAVSHKQDTSPVTRADRDAEAIMRACIEETYPDHGILGEEHGNIREDAEYVWVLDPIDGTKTFITAVPLFGTLIGLLHRGKPILGAIHQPVLQQLCIGDNETTTLNGEPVQVRQKPLEEATLLTSDVTLPAQYQTAGGWEKLVHQVRLLRTWGDCYGYLLLASGWADIMVDPVVEPWDILPLVPIIQGAGGTITNWQGGALIQEDGTFSRSCVAAHPDTHGDIIRLLNDSA